MDPIQQPNRPPRYWRKNHPHLAVNKFTARVLADIASDHDMWSDAEVIAWYHHEGQQIRAVLDEQ